MNVITRFAPSPTGDLHIGGARTALFNYLFAAHFNGRYLVRVEDTDKKRSTKEAINAIYSGLNWLGLAGQEDFIFQSHNINRHREIAEQMLQSSHAYKCYLTSEELEILKAQNIETGKMIRSPWRDRDASQAPENGSYVVRIKMEPSPHPFHDMVYGSVSVDAGILDDFILLRSDGTPTYMLAVVVDDHDMGVTHVIRGSDHLNNAFRQRRIYECLDWNIPNYAHIPLIHGSDGAKLSKRHGALNVEAYKEMGFLPEAMVNYLARLGWSHGDDELFSHSEAIKWFNGKHIGTSPAKFDMDKLKSVNRHWLNKKPIKSLSTMNIISHLADENPSLEREINESSLETYSLILEKYQAFTELASTIFKDNLMLRLPYENIEDMLDIDLNLGNLDDISGFADMFLNELDSSKSDERHQTLSQTLKPLLLAGEKNKTIPIMHEKRDVLTLTNKKLDVLLLPIERKRASRYISEFQFGIYYGIKCIHEISRAWQKVKESKKFRKHEESSNTHNSLQMRMNALSENGDLLKETSPLIIDYFLTMKMIEILSKRHSPLIKLYQERVQTLTELREVTKWLFLDSPPEISGDKAGLLSDQARENLTQFTHFIRASPLAKKNFEPAFKEWLAIKELKMKDIGSPLRIAITGTASAPSLIEVIYSIGLDEVINRIDEICKP